MQQRKGEELVKEMQQKGTLGRVRAWEGFLVLVLVMRCRCPWDWRAVLGATGSLQLTANKEGGPQYYNHKKLDAALNLKKFGSRIFPESP